MDQSQESHIACAPGKKTAIINVRVFDGDQLTEPQTIVIDNGIIGNDAKGAETIDAQQGILIPGLIDCHIHVQDENDLLKMAQWGVTTGLGMGDWPPEKVKSLRGRKGMADLRSPGAPATSPGSTHSKMLPLPAEDLVSGPEDVPAYVEKRISEGADYIKIIADVPGPDQETLNAISAAAHERGKLVIAHASAYKPFAMAQTAKADVVTHVPADKALDDEAVATMLNEGRISVPTLAMAEAQRVPPKMSTIAKMIVTQPSAMWTVAKAQRSREAPLKYENARDSVTAMHRAGVPVLAGTDAHTEPTSPWEVIQGEALHRELELLVEAGMSTLEALRAATCLAAKHFGLADRGVIAEGNRADLVLLSEDPIADIKATRSIERVWAGGIEIRR